MIIYGKNSVYEFLKNKQVKKIYLINGFDDKKILNSIEKISTKYVDRIFLDKLTNGLHQGVAAEIDDYSYSNIDIVIGKENQKVVILDHLEDPHNFGAIIRTCEAAGFDAIIIPNKRSVEVNPTVIKTSVGALSNINIIMVSNIVSTIDYLKKNNYWIVGTDMEGTCYTDIDYSGNIAIVIGNEGSGISDLVRKNCDFIASIPMIGKINSLNASVATGILIYEVLRQQNIK